MRSEVKEAYAYSARVTVPGVAYGEHLERVFERRAAFCGGEMGDQVLACFSVQGLSPGSHLRHVPDYRRMCDVQVEHLEARTALLDDSVPVLQTHFGMGIFGALFGSEVVWRPEDETSWSAAPFDDWPEDYAARLRFDPDHPLVTLVRQGIRYCCERSRGRFGVGLLETIDALNLVNELRGATRGFMDLYLHPEIVAEVMELGVQWNIDWLEMQMAETGPFGGGWVSLVDWFPWPTVWLSVDAYGCCRTDTYVTMGRPYMQCLIDHFGHGWQHLHSDGVRLLPEIIKLRNLVGVQIGEDVGYPRPYEIVRELKHMAGGLPLQVGCRWDEFRRDLTAGALAGGVEYHVSGAPSIGAANGLAELARAYRDPGPVSVERVCGAERNRELEGTVMSGQGGIPRGG